MSRDWIDFTTGKNLILFHETNSKSSQRRRRTQTSVSNVCEAVPRSLFWAPNGLNELPEVSLEFPFILIGKLTIAFLTG